MLSDNENRQREYFDELAKRREHETKDSKPRTYILQDVYAVVTAQPESHRVLEIGCGDGSAGFTEYFVSKGLEVSFLDISGEAVRYLANRLERAGYKGFKPFVGTFKEVAPKLQGEVFDVIFFGDTLHHLTEQETVSLLDDLVPFMHPRTKVVAFEPNGHWPFWRVMPRFNRDFMWQVEKNIVHCTRGGFERKFRQAGMALESYTYQRIVPLMLMDKGAGFRILNKLITRIPVLRLLSAYTIVIAGRGN